MALRALRRQRIDRAGDRVLLAEKIADQHYFRARGERAAALIPSWKMAQLHLEHRGLQRIEAAVFALDDVFVLLCLPQIAQQA